MCGLVTERLQPCIWTRRGWRGTSATIPAEHNPPARPPASSLSVIAPRSDGLRSLIFKYRTHLPAYPHQHTRKANDGLAYPVGMEPSSTRDKPWGQTVSGHYPQCTPVSVLMLDHSRRLGSLFYNTTTCNKAH